MNKSKEISAQLWDMANKLRGTMDASEYKNYILPFMFYRYLSEKQDEYLKDNGLEDFYTASGEELREYLKDLKINLSYVVLPEYSWSELISKIADYKIKASDYQDMFDAFRENATQNSGEAESLADIFSDMNLGDMRLGSDINERARALNEIVLMINDFNFKDESGHDILGDVYEYLIGEFAANAGKKGGEFYTPHEVSQILAKITTLHKNNNGEQFRVYDPTMGSGSLLLTVQKELTSERDSGKVEFHGQELNATTYNLARMNLMMHDVNYSNMKLKRGDTLSAVDWPSIEENGVQSPLRFDAVVANPPYSQQWDIENIDRNKDVRFKNFGIAPKSKADYAFVLHGLHHLANDGTMAIVLPHGVLFRGAAEAKIRKKLIDENLVDAVIGLPANLFYGTSIPTCILVIKGREARKNTKDILFIDASNHFEKAKNKNKLRKEDISKILEAYSNRQNIEKYAHVASIEEIRDNDYNLNIPRYVDTFEEDEVKPLAEIAEEMKEIDREVKEVSNEILISIKNLVGTTPEAQKELEEFIKIMES